MYVRLRWKCHKFADSIQELFALIDAYSPKAGVLENVGEIDFADAGDVESALDVLKRGLEQRDYSFHVDEHCHRQYIKCKRFRFPYSA